MRLNNFRGLWLMSFAVSLAILACGIGDTGSGVTETAITKEPEPSAVEATTETTVAESEGDWETDRKALDEALAAVFSEDEAFVAVAAAAEYGYVYGQLEGAILNARLQKDGRVLAGDDTELAPASERAGVLDLANLELALHSNMADRSTAKPRRQDGLIPAARLLQGVEDLATSSELDPAADASNPNALLILQITRSGYTLDQIVETIFLGGKIGWFFDCFFLVDVDGTPMRAKNFNEGCYTDLFGHGEVEGVIKFPDEENPPSESEPEADNEEVETVTATLTIDDVQVERTNCTQEQQGHAFKLDCEFSVLMTVSYEAPATPFTLYCEARSGIAQGNGETVLEFISQTGTENVIIPGLTLEKVYIDEDQNGAADPRDDIDLNRDNDGIFTGLKCGISGLPFESRVTFFPSAWAEASCPHPDSDEPATCFGPWLDLAEAHAWD